MRCRCDTGRRTLSPLRTFCLMTVTWVLAADAVLVVDVCLCAYRLPACQPACMSACTLHTSACRPARLFALLIDPRGCGAVICRGGLFSLRRYKLNRLEVVNILSPSCLSVCVDSFSVFCIVHSVPINSEASR